MSHFFTAVLCPKGTMPNAAEAVAGNLLAPFHEFECTGRDDQYVQDIDRTAEATAEFATQTVKRVRTPAGELVDAYSDSFYRDPTPEELAKIGPMGGTGWGGGFSFTSKDWGDGLGYRAKVRHVPDGHAEVDVPVKECESFAEWCERWYGWETVAYGERPDLTGKHQYGYILTDENGNVVRCVDRTNPNKKWDWWSVGGRYTGRMGTYDPAKDARNYEPCIHCGGTGTRPDIAYGPAEAWARAGNEVFPCKGRGCNACYGAGMSLKFPSDFRNVGNVSSVSELADDFSCFAVVTPDGEWIERGSMGWWGCVSGEKDDETWKQQLKTVLARYRDCIAVGVDCHI